MIRNGRAAEVSLKAYFAERSAHDVAADAGWSTEVSLATLSSRRREGCLLLEGTNCRGRFEHTGVDFGHCVGVCGGLSVGLILRSRR